MAKLERLITPGALKALAGGTAFGRGEDYFADGAVERLRRSDEKVSAQVMGSETYQVELWADGDVAVAPERRTGISASTASLSDWPCSMRKLPTQMLASLHIGAIPNP
jgi:uncharacterized Zn finger protein